MRTKVGVAVVLCTKFGCVLPLMAQQKGLWVPEQSGLNVRQRQLEQRKHHSGSGGRLIDCVPSKYFRNAKFESGFPKPPAAFRVHVLRAVGVVVDAVSAAVVDV
jgi:hypothetical protein